MHVNYHKIADPIENTEPDLTIFTDCTLEEIAAIRIIAKDPGITQNEPAERLGKSLPTAKNITSNLQNKNIIARIGGKRYGSWQIINKEK